MPVSEALRTAIAALEPYQQTAGGGGGGIGGILGALSGRTKVTARPERLKVSGRGLFYGQLSKDDQRAFQKAFSFEDDSPLRACFGDGNGYAALVVAVDQRGRVTRCEALGPIGAEDTCACQVLLQHARVAAPARGRRARVFVNRRAADAVTPSQIVVTAYNRIYNQRYKNSKGKWRSRPAVSNRAIEAYRPPPAHGLTRCFRKRKDTGWIQLTVDIPFDAKGHATKPRMFRIRKNKDTVGLTKAESACVLSYLKATRAPCPKKAGSVARLSVNIRMRKLGAPLGHRFLGGVSCRQLKKRRAKRPPQRRSRPHNRCPPFACCAGLVGFVARYASLDAGRVAVSWSRC